MVMMVIVIVATALAVLAVLVMMLVMMLVVMLVLMIVIVATALAVLAVLVVVLMLMIVIVATALAILTVLVMVLVVMLMLMIVIVTTALAILAVLVMVLVVMSVLHKLGKLTLNGVFVLHSRYNVRTCELIPIGSNNCCVIIETLDDVKRAIKLFLGNILGVGENYGVGKFDLVVEKLTEILCVFLALICINNSCEAVEHHILCGYVLYCLNNVGKLANSGGLDENALGGISLNHFGESFSEIAHKRAADAAGIHFGNFNSRILHKSAVNTDGSELVFNKNKLFSAEGFLYKLFDECGFTCTQKS